MEKYFKNCFVLIFFLIKLSDLGKCNEVVDQCPKTCQCLYPTTDKRIMAIECSKRDMIEIISRWPQNKTHMTVSFAHNPIEQLGKIIPATNATLSLSFKNCSLEVLETGLFTEAIHVEYLDLSWNLLRGEDLHADIFRGRYNEEQYEPIGIVELNLAHNEIKSLEHNLFEHMPNLTKLDLSSNPLGKIDDETWTALLTIPYLKSLNLHNTSLTAFHITLHEFQPPLLKNLDLSYNNLRSVPKTLAKFSKSLERLRIDGNLMIELNDESFLGLNKLQILEINEMSRLRNIKHNTFSSLKELKTLHLSRNPKLIHIYKDAFGEPQNWPPIKELYIKDNNLKELREDLLNWTSITVIRTEGNPWVCDCEIPPCVCPRHIVNQRSFDILYERPADTPIVNRLTLIIVPLILFTIMGAFAWRCLVKYRSYRVVNTMYPVMYTNSPYPPSH